MLRDPYVAGVERFELLLTGSAQLPESIQRKEHAALFCLLLWKQFQSNLRVLRYHLSFEQREDLSHEFSQQPRYEDLLDFDSSHANQIDIELISQQPAHSPKYPQHHSQGKDEHFPAFLEIFIPLWPHLSVQIQPLEDVKMKSPVVIWCQPAVLPQVTSLWEQASTLLRT